MSKVTMLNCPGCGAPLATDSSRCEFCRARVEISADKTKFVLAGIVCPECGSENAPERLFCGMCGSNLKQNCHNCGEANPLGVQYCGGCGMALHETREAAARKLRQKAIDKGLYKVTRYVTAYEQLYDTVAEPGETIIIFRAGGRDEALITESESGSARPSAFVATDRSFIFLDRKPRVFLGLSDERLAKRVPFEMVRSLTLQESSAHLLIDFDGGLARVNLPAIHGGPGMPGAREAAERIIHCIKPFLPVRLQQGW